MTGFPMERDERLLEYATDRQREVAERVWTEGSITAAARSLGLQRPTVQNSLRQIIAKSARQGYAPGYGLTDPVPEGYVLKGASTLYNRRTGEPILQWIKSKDDPEAQERLMAERVRALVEDLPRIESTPAPDGCWDRIMVGYPIPDGHLGMYAWGDETGDADYDLETAERLHHRAMAYLVRNAPPASTALVAVLGDFFHYDSLEPVTPRSKHQLDSDGRFAKMVRVGIRTVRRMIDLALEKHARVVVTVDPGNHDPSIGIFLREALAALYEREDRVHVDATPTPYHFVEFGRCLVATTHGHLGKLDDLPLVLATDHPDVWGRTTHRTWWTGHVHRDRVLNVQGTTVESFKPLIPRDAYATENLYRSRRGMVSVTFHAEHGEVGRATVTPGMVE